jgi:NDP-sugar pyrophosphorylase family protein
MSVPVVIQAGGMGARLYPYTKVLPKPLMPVGDLPILEIVIRQLAARGFRNINITVGYLGDMIRLCCGDGSRWGVGIRYWPETKPLGTMGPLKQITGLDQPFMVMNGDLLTDFDFAAFYDWHRSHGAPLSVATFCKPVTISLGVLQTVPDGKIVGFAEKPTMHFSCSMGIYCVDPTLLAMIPSGEPFGFDDLMHAVLAKGVDARSYPFSGTWMDIGRPEDFALACEAFEQNPTRFLPDAAARKAA